MATHKALNNFTGGEWTPHLDGRSDLLKYDAAMRLAQNVRCLPWGGFSGRPGTLMVAPAINQAAGFPSRTVPFNYSTTLTYTIEMGYTGFGALHVMRFYYASGTQAGTQVQVASAPGWVTGTVYAQNQYLTGLVGGVSHWLFVTLGYTSGATPAVDIAAFHLQDLGPVSAGPAPYQIVSPYLFSDQLNLRVRQINGVMYMTNPGNAALGSTGYQVYKLVYAGPVNWSIAPVAWKYPPLLDQNTVQADTLALGALTGSTTMTAAGSGFAPFNAAHVGSYWEIQQLRPSTSMQLSLGASSGTTTSASMAVQGDWTFSTSQYWYGNLFLQASYDNGSSWTTLRQFTSACDGNFTTSGTEPAPNIGDPQPLYRIQFTATGAPFSPAIWTGAAPTQYAIAEASFSVNSAYIAGLVQVTAFTDTTHVTVNVIVSPVTTSASYLWSEGAFSAFRGFPTAVDFYEQRVLYAGTAFKPNTIYGSVAGDFDNFQYGANDDDAIAFQPAVSQQNVVQWLASLLRVHAGTSGEEIIMASGNFDEAITPSNVTVRQQSTYGSAAVEAILVNNSILFIERNGRRLREMRELSPYVVPTDFVAPDLTLFAEHILKPGVNQMDYARLPDPLVYTVRTDGQMPVMTYNREQNITAWSRYVTAGTYESVACVQGTPSDSVWCSVLRTINGTSARFIEVFTTDPGDSPDAVNNCLLDCAFAATQASSTTVNGLSYLNGQAISVVADGKLAGTFTPAGGSITLPFAASVIRAGLPYTCTAQTMKMDFAMANGTSQGRQRRVTQVVARFKDTVGAQWMASSGGGFESIPFNSTAVAKGGAIPLFSGDIPVPWDNGIDFDGSLTIQQTMPFPFTVLGLFPKVDAFGD